MPDRSGIATKYWDSKDKIMNFVSFLNAGPSRLHKSYPGIPRPRDDSCKGFPTTTNGQKFGLRAYLGFLFLNQGTPSRPHEHRLGRPKPWWKWYPAKTAIRRTWPTHTAALETQRHHFPPDAVRLRFPKEALAWGKTLRHVKVPWKPRFFPMFFSMFGHRTNEAFDCWPLASRGHDIKIVWGWHSKWSQLKDIF